MVVSEIKLFELLKAKIGKEEAEAFIEILETRVNGRIDEKTNVFETREDIARVETKIAESKVDIIKWMVATAIAIVGILIAVIKIL